LALAVVVVLNSPAFRVSSIVVEGHGYLSREDVLSAAGVRTGDRMITFRPAAARSSLLKLPHVAAAEVRRVWPRGVRIVLRERTGLALLPCGTGWVEVASDGVAIQLHVALEATGLPVLEGVDATLVGVGERVPGVNARTALEALAIAAARSEPARRAVLATTGLELELMDGTWLYLGAAGSVVETRISAALAILEELRARGQRAAYIDVRVPGQPVIRPR
jgi:cell division septal protein FtsQ